MATGPPWVKSFPHKEHPDSTIRGLTIVEMLNPDRQLFLRCEDTLKIVAVIDV